MSEKQPKLKFEEDKERTATRSPPKKSKVEQSKPKKQKLKQDADKAAEKAQHLRFGKAEITPDEASRMTKQQKRAMYAAAAARSAVHREVDQYEDDNVGTQALSEGEKAAGNVRDISKSIYARKLKKKAKMQGKKGAKTAKSSPQKPTAAQDAGESCTGEGCSNWLSRWRQKQDIRQSYYAAAHSGTAAQTAGGKAASNGTNAAKSGMEQVIDKGRSVVSTAVNGIANFAKSNAHVLLIVGVFLLLLLLVMSAFSSCSILFSDTTQVSGQTIYTAEDRDIRGAEVTIVTAVHNIKSNKGSKTAGVDKIKMDKYLQMPKDELILLIQSCFRNYRPKPARREYIEKSNGKKRPLGIPTVLDRIIQECVRIIIEPICEARFYPQSYGFRPYRAQKHAIRGIINVINAGCKSPDQPVWAIEGDIKGCFDNINHRLLLQKLWRIGIHDKRVLKIISQMLKAGYMENDLFHATELGTPQGGILSPLLSNVYLNDFDWYVGRMYMEPHRQCKHKGNDTRRLKWAGVTPKYNYRYADDWVILTSTEKEALRLKRVLTKYFRNRMKLDLSQEKTYVTDLRTNGIHFLGFVVKAERKRKTPDPATWTNHLVGKPLPDMERLGKKTKKLLEEVHRIELCQKVNAGRFTGKPG